jgi:hypothetical protein
MRSIEMAHSPVGIAGEHRNGGVLMPFAVLAAQVVLESAAAGAKKAQPLPAARASVCAQSRDISAGNDGEVKVLSEMMRHTIGAVDLLQARYQMGGFLIQQRKIADEQA